jgi:ABC-type oligopeptide transport system substrate-binding subunit
VRFGVVGSPATLDPYSPVASELTYELAVPVYPSLYRFDPHGHPHAYLARAIESTRGGVRVRLRRARWSDGHPVSAADVVSTWRRARLNSGFSRVTSARALGPREVELHGHVRDWKQALATLSYVLPGGRPMRLSAGPFRVKSYTPGLRMVFERNRRWWGHPALATLEVEFVQSLQVLLLLLGEGKLDAAAPPSSVNLDTRLDALGVHHSDSMGWESVQLRFPGHGLTLAERRSLGAAVDRAQLARGFIRDEGRISTTLTPGPGTEGTRGPWSQQVRAGPPVHRPVTLSAPSGDELLELVQRALQVEMKTTAPDLELVGIDPQTFYGPWRVHNPTQVALSRTSGAPGFGRDTGAYRQARAVPLFEVATVVAWRDGIRGIKADPTFDGPFWNLARWTAAPP